MAIKNGVDNGVSIRSLVSKSEVDIINNISVSLPKIVVVMDKELIGVWKKVQQKNHDINQIPSILLGSEFFNNVDELSKGCLISYETKLEHYIDRVIQLTGNKPSNIGVVFSSKSQNQVQSYQNESSMLNVNLYAKQVIISDPENSIKTIVENFIDHYHIDFMIILNDQAVINNQNINTTWVSVLKSLKIPIAVPSDYFYECEPRIGSFAIQPHYTEIGRVAASVINDAEANDWIIKQKSIYVDKSIFYSRNKDGTISQQNQLQNQNLVSYHPKTRNDSYIQTPVESEATPGTQNLAYNERSQYDSVKLIKSKAPTSSDSAIAIKETVTEKPSASIASIDNQRLSNKKSEQSSTVPITSNKQKVDQSEPTNDKSIATRQPLRENDRSKDHSIQNQPFQFIASNHDKYKIEIIAASASIYKELTSELPILGLGQLGDKLNVTSEDSLWYCVDYNGTSGFLSKADARKFTQKNFFAKLADYDHLLMILTIIVLIAVLSLIYVLIRLKILRHNRASKIKCLMITKKKKFIKYSNINDKYISLVKYLKNYGFHVILSKNLKHTSELLLFNIPDIICIDWQFERDIQSKVYEMLKDQSSGTSFILIFYNIVDPSSIQKNSNFDERSFFFNRKFTISDLNSVISMVKEKTDSSQQLPDQSSSWLEGKITGDTLSEIFQLMDINKKTGCLQIKNHHPVGMIFFEDGIITYAITNTLVAEDAVFNMLSMKHGRFQFIPEKKPVARQMELSVVAVLMEKAKLLDEIETVP